MITPENLYEIAKSRYDESKILLQYHKPDGAVYLCGYALELILKRQIVKTLKWDGYPAESNQFKEYQSFKTHKLDVLLHLSGSENKIKEDTTMYAKWLKASAWNSEIRYKEVGKITENEARGIIDATRDVVNFIFTP